MLMVACHRAQEAQHSAEAQLAGLQERIAALEHQAAAQQVHEPRTLSPSEYPKACGYLVCQRCSRCVCATIFAMVRGAWDLVSLGYPNLRLRAHQRPTMQCRRLPPARRPRWWHSAASTRRSWLASRTPSGSCLPRSHAPGRRRRQQDLQHLTRVLTLLLGALLVGGQLRAGGPAGGPALGRADSSRLFQQGLTRQWASRRTCIRAAMRALRAQLSSNPQTVRWAGPWHRMLVSEGTTKSALQVLHKLCCRLCCMRASREVENDLMRCTEPARLSGFAKNSHGCTLNQFE